MRRTNLVSGLLFGMSVSAILISVSLNAAPPKSSSKSVSKISSKTDSKPAADDGIAEAPAVPYLTLTLARDPSVQTELKLNAQQIEAVRAAISEVNEPFWQLRDVPVKKCQVQLEGLRSRLMTRLKQDLTTSQFERFNQIVFQGRSYKALVSAEVVEQLGFSVDQVARLRTALKEAIKEREATEKDPAGKDPQRRAKLRESEARRMTEVMTVGQQTKYQSLLGQPFDFSRVTQVGCDAPELRKVSSWLNTTTPLSLGALRGQVVVVHFWAFECHNCVNNLPHYQSWFEKFGDKITIIGIHTPETDTERQLGNVQANLIQRKIRYPVVVDNASENWKAWGNHTWPSVYLIDKQGRVRNWWYGELNWDGAKGEEFMRRRIEELLEDNMDAIPALKPLR